MKPSDPDTLVQMRKMAKEGASATKILAHVDSLLPSQELPRKLVLIQYFREAFFLSLAEASPIAGYADGNGEIPEQRLNEFLGPAIAMHQAAWDKR